MPPPIPDITVLLNAASAGDARAANELMPLVYAELRKRAAGLMRRERDGHTLQATALVHDAYVKLVQQQDVDWRGRTHFFALSAQAMRRILVDHARSRSRDKRGGAYVKVSLDEGKALSADSEADVIALDAALQGLAELDTRQAQIVEMRFFGGLRCEDVAHALGVSKRTIEGEWTMAKAWLRRELAN